MSAKYYFNPKIHAMIERQNRIRKQKMVKIFFKIYTSYFNS